MKAAVISLMSKSSKMIAESMRKYFDEVDEIDLQEVDVALTSKDFEVQYKGQSLTKYDCIYARGSFRFASVLVSITTALKDHCYMALEPKAFTVGHDKFLTQLTLLKNNVPMPNAYVAPTAKATQKVLKDVTYPIIIKVPSGTHGKGVLFSESYASAVSMCDALMILKQPFILQEYIETGGEDIRAIVAGKKVVAAMKRKAAKGEKRANIHAGGEGEGLFLDEETQQVCIRAAQATGCDICGVDLLVNQKGSYVLEVNVSPGLQGITKATNIDVADKIAVHLFHATKKFKKKQNAGVLDEILKEPTEPAANESLTVIADLDFKGSRVMLPADVARMAQLTPSKEYTFKVQKGKILIEEGN